MKTLTYDFLDALPDSLYQTVVTHAHGTLEQRCKAVMLWRQALYAGRLAETVNWPDPESKQEFICRLLDQDLLQRTVDNFMYCDQVLIDLLHYLSGEQANLLLRDADNAPDQMACTPHRDPLSQQMAGLFRDFAVVDLPGMDMEQGNWQPGDRRKLLSLYRLVKRSSYLHDIMLLIGRGRKTAKAGSAEYNNVLARQPRIKRYPQTQGVLQARGIYLSDDISRILPAELMALGHPLLKSLWHARRAERRLMCYQYEGVMPTHLPDFDLQPAAPDLLANNEVRQQGPIILCLDTSASMKGLPELRARAITLAAMRVAFHAGRQCLLFMFSGVGEIQEYELNQSVNGWRHLMRIINHGFQGGTDVGGVLQHALARLQQARWEDADICLVSDGRFMADAVLEHIKQLPGEYDLRLHGLHVSRWKATQMERLCQWVYHLENLWEQA